MLPMLPRLPLLLTALLFACLGIRGNDLPVRYLGIEQGLSNNAILSLYQDHQGFIWIGTYDGLNRYDGYSFRTFRNVIGDSTSLSTNNVYSLGGDDQHQLWVGGQRGLNIYNPLTEQFTTAWYIDREKNRTVKMQSEITCMANIGDGAMLTGSHFAGLLLYENKSRTATQVPLLTPTGILYNYHARDIEYDPVHHIAWVFIQGHGLFRYDTRQKELHLATNALQQAYCLRATKQGDVWIGSGTGLYLFQPSKNSLSDNRMPNSSNVVDLLLDHRDVLWIGTDGAGVYQLPPGAATALPHQSAAGLPYINSNVVYSILEDRDGRMWIGTLRGGINVIEPQAKPFHQVTYQQAGSSNPIDNFILSFCEDDRHNLYIGTDGAGLRYWNRQQNTYTTYKRQPGDAHAISSNFITGITKDDQQDIWVSTWFGAINRLKHNSRQFEHFTLFNPKTNAYENNTWLVYQDTQKDIWAGATNDGSLYRFNRAENRFELFDPSIVNLQCLAEDRAGNLWGGNYTSVIRIDRERKQHRLYNIGFPVRAIHEDRRGNFWVGTQGAGLLLLDKATGRFKQFTTTDGLPGNTILRLLEDAKGNCWISTYNGLARFDPVTKSCTNFSQTDGLQSNQFSFNAGLALSSGHFVFGGIRGFNIFHPDSIPTQKATPTVFLDGLRIDNKAMDEHDGYITARDLESIRHITIPYDKAALALDFLALDYSGSQKIKYTYLLQGWDKSWNNARGSRTANYSRLQEGDYVFLVRTSNPDGSWGPETALLQVTVLPPWYRSWWAFALYTLAVFSLIYIYIRYTRRQERLRYEIRLAHLEHEKDKELSEKKLTFFTNISHEFRTPLSLIINPIREKLGRQQDVDLTVAYRNARRLLSLVDQLLLFRKAGSDTDVLKIAHLNISSLCNEVFQCFVQQASARRIHYHFEAIDPDVMVYADYEKIEIALFNLLSNAFKFTPDGGSIGFSVRPTANTVTISISDSGCGIREADRDSIFEKFQQSNGSRTQKTGFGIGLYLVKHFVTSHQGMVAVTSKENEGATFTITLQKGRAHLPAGSVEADAKYDHQLLEELAGESTQPPTPAAAAPTAGRTAEELITGKKTVLVIDDNAEIREYLQHIFGDRYFVYVADNGMKGLELANQHLPDLIISDINMDGIDGLELCRKVKQSDVLGHIPVILLTAASSADTKLKGIEGGADDYITKPFDSQLLLARVETTIRNRSQLQRFFLDNITLGESAVKVPAEYKEFLQHCIEVVEQHLDTEDFTIQKFCKAMGLSRSTLYLKVKHISGQSLNAFIRSVRLRRAAVLMIRENMNVNQAAFQVGIGDVRYFREQFVKLFGMTPSEYIKKYRQSFNSDHHLIRPEDGQ
ncbi:two-component regulator propeller domain-containing protein [Paraflavitalea sp. CAU 1676]|uniref:hybrid sensor histidine kinase/response regulator transcription factor n=1 Tax=Paraflavitalea sp. CAU 1676 TaxID=3032598 RepID=UPI0023DACD22|nr:two-component regulator propeller domain-containing protein [Paraflavitalea sp. CAU 1676]MDF2192456.1 two-component regulator propeller domain-containing protein [Paraflavitalea sp. CAU 1676]